MPFIGNQPAESYASFETETFTVSATANYTLSHAVTNENEIRLVINGVVQQPGSGKAYTASGTTLTLSSATVSGDSMYAVYLGRALQTVNPPAASVGNSQTASTIITGQTAETSIATDDTILIHDTSASALRKMTRANFVSGVGGANTPSFLAFPSGNQSIPNNSSTKLTYTSEQVDNGSAYDATNSKFVAPSAGLYFFNFSFRLNGFEDQEYAHAFLYLNGSNYIRGGDNFQASGSHAYYTSNSWILNLSTNDYIEAYIYHYEGGSNDTEANYGSFSGFKLIT
jgi:hypothetical protein